MESEKRRYPKIPKGFTVAVEDECIFVHDALIRRKMWTAEGVRPVVMSTGSHRKTSVFGTIFMDGRQFFGQYYAFNQYTFLKYLKQLERKFGRLILFIESIKVKKYLEEHHDAIRIEYFPKGSPEFNAIEECWRQGKHDLLVSKYYPRFTHLNKAIAEYYRTKRFNLDIVRYLLRNIT